MGAVAIRLALACALAHQPHGDPMSVEDENLRLRARVARLEEEVAYLRSSLGTAFMIPPQWHLRPREKQLLACLYGCKAGLCTYDRIDVALEQYGGITWERGMFKVLVYRIRDILRPAFPAGPIIITHYAEGYEIGPPVRAAIDEYVTQSREMAA